MHSIKQLLSLLKVKTIVTLAVIAVFCALALRGGIRAPDVMIIVTNVTAFYFGTQHERRNQP